MNPTGQQVNEPNSDELRPRCTERNPAPTRSKGMLGTFAPQKEPYVYALKEDTTPSGALARGVYSAKLKFEDDDKRKDPYSTKPLEGLKLTDVGGEVEFFPSYKFVSIAHAASKFGDFK
ncbi:rho GDP-dissociation inhibitor 1-like protein [Trifolium pratense]|uniref:Rho GDP-dissociation inhibitor 1-like protein n=1 Tax=Trifolium pratense TaxID=57577 RepID=A0A2K3N557_TRIPR|nr:rho GDP-dissociation inhibitor 1-like protein [Trifolium pratense]